MNTVKLLEVSLEDKKEEALKRMLLLNVFGKTREEFRDTGMVNYSENGILYWFDPEKDQSLIEPYKAMKAFEEKYGALVYHVIRNRTEFGELWSMLYVSAHKEEWEYDHSDIQSEYTVAYVFNATDPDLSEIGGICIKSRFGGLLRTY